MDIRGGYAKPKVTDILWVQLVFLPWTLASWAYFYGRWFWKFGVRREEYGEAEKLYVIRKNMGLSQGQFDVRRHGKTIFGAGFGFQKYKSKRLA